MSFQPFITSCCAYLSFSSGSRKLEKKYWCNDPPWFKSFYEWIVVVLYFYITVAENVFFYPQWNGKVFTAPCSLYLSARTNLYYSTSSSRFQKFRFPFKRFSWKLCRCIHLSIDIQRPPFRLVGCFPWGMDECTMKGGRKCKVACWKKDEISLLASCKQVFPYGWLCCNGIARDMVKLQPGCRFE